MSTKLNWGLFFPTFNMLQNVPKLELPPCFLSLFLETNWNQQATRKVNKE
jgi:hypothetical protein